MKSLTKKPGRTAKTRSKPIVKSTNKVWLNCEDTTKNSRKSKQSRFMPTSNCPQIVLNSRDSPTTIRLLAMEKTLKQSTINNAFPAVPKPMRNKPLPPPKRNLGNQSDIKFFYGKNAKDQDSPLKGNKTKKAPLANSDSDNDSLNDFQIESVHEYFRDRDNNKSFHIAKKLEKRKLSLQNKAKKHNEKILQFTRPATYQIDKHLESQSNRRIKDHDNDGITTRYTDDNTESMRTPTHHGQRNQRANQGRNFSLSPASNEEGRTPRNKGADVDEDGFKTPTPSRHQKPRRERKSERLDSNGNEREKSSSIVREGGQANAKYWKRSLSSPRFKNDLGHSTIRMKDGKKKREELSLITDYAPKKGNFEINTENQRSHRSRKWIKGEQSRYKNGKGKGNGNNGDNGDNDDVNCSDDNIDNSNNNDSNNMYNKVKHNNNDDENIKSKDKRYSKTSFSRNNDKNTNKSSFNTTDPNINDSVSDCHRTINKSVQKNEIDCNITQLRKMKTNSDGSNNNEYAYDMNCTDYNHMKDNSKISSKKRENKGHKISHRQKDSRHIGNRANGTENDNANNIGSDKEFIKNMTYDSNHHVGEDSEKQNSYCENDLHHEPGEYLDEPSKIEYNNNQFYEHQGIDAKGGRFTYDGDCKNFNYMHNDDDDDDDDDNGQYIDMESLKLLGIDCDRLSCKNGDNDKDNDNDSSDNDHENKVHLYDNFNDKNCSLNDNRKGGQTKKVIKSYNNTKDDYGNDNDKSKYKIDMMSEIQIPTTNSYKLNDCLDTNNTDDEVVYNSPEHQISEKGNKSSGNYARSYTYRWKSDNSLKSDKFNNSEKAKNSKIETQKVKRTYGEMLASVSSKANHENVNKVNTKRMNDCLEKPDCEKGRNLNKHDNYNYKRKRKKIDLERSESNDKNIISQIQNSKNSNDNNFPNNRATGDYLNHNSNNNNNNSKNKYNIGTGSSDIIDAYCKPHDRSAINLSPKLEFKHYGEDGHDIPNLYNQMTSITTNSSVLTKEVKGMNDNNCKSFIYDDDSLSFAYSDDSNCNNSFVYDDENSNNSIIFDDNNFNNSVVFNDLQSSDGFDFEQVLDTDYNENHEYDLKGNHPKRITSTRLTESKKFEYLNETDTERNFHHIERNCIKKNNTCDDEVDSFGVKGSQEDYEESNSWNRYRASQMEMAPHAPSSDQVRKYLL